MKDTTSPGTQSKILPHGRCGSGSRRIHHFVDGGTSPQWPSGHHVDSLMAKGCIVWSLSPWESFFLLLPFHPLSFLPCSPHFLLLLPSVPFPWLLPVFSFPFLLEAPPKRPQHLLDRLLLARSSRSRVLQLELLEEFPLQSHRPFGPLQAM